MSGQRPRDHGRDHRAGGADPIPGLSDALHWGDNTDTSSLGLTLTANANVEITAQTDDDDARILISQRGAAGDLGIEADGELHIDSDDQVDIHAPVIFLGHSTLHARMRIDQSANKVIVSLPVGKSFEIQDHNGDPIFRVDEDASVHIVTGGTIVADL